ncbi:conserved exported hypothetical protein [Candidatus Sulfopaludibacter sp. SbA3]|nr:conserved exported hypothetical protein [Candidatus Sulfopaludibacter sp. SbA3]
MRVLYSLSFWVILSGSAAAAPAPTFSKDVAPILQHNCQGCHRPGEAAPMPLLTYQQARPWAKAMKEAVLLKKMPPWPADPQVGHFSNDRSLPAKDRDTLIAWVDGGAPEGNPKDLPQPAAWVDGWNIGKPDRIIEMPAPFDVPASGTIEYQYVILPLNLTEDRWIQAAEARPGNRAVVHHIIAFIRDPGSKWMRDKPYGEVFVPRNAKGDVQGFSGDILAGFAPGVPPSRLEPGTARLVKAGSDVVFQLHYTANGKAAQDQTKVGFIFAKEPPKERVLTLAAANTKFTIPAGDPDYKVDSDLELAHDVKLVSMLPHMHLRGKDFEYRLIFPTGETQAILRVPRYDFGWQLSYDVAGGGMTLPKGTRIACTAHFDNSPNNPANPDPTKEVKWGDQSWDEMMIGFLEVAIPADMDPKLILPEKKPQRKTSDNGN